MGPYGGQNVLISTVITNFDDTVMISPDVQTVVLDISDPTRTSILSGQNMTYDPTYVNDDGSMGAYVYLWATPAIAEGGYTVRIQATGPNLNSKTYKTIRIRRNKDPFDV